MAPSRLREGRSHSRLREWGLNLAAFVFSLALIYASAEAYVSLAVDDGMQFDLEMWRYSRYLKRVSANPAIGHEHAAGSSAHLMGADVAISSQGLRDRDFDAALALYKARPDKGYSLTDCRSMLALRALGVTEVLTNDHHFTQERFTVLFP